MKPGETKYINLHQWIRKHLGKPEKCSSCGVNGLSGHKIHWANKSGKYKRDINDWIRLCVSCHKKFDGCNPEFRSCRVCNKRFQITPSRVKTAKYCSFKCRAIEMRGGNHPSWKENKKVTQVNCGVCGKAFIIKSYRIGLGLGKWCSRDCFNKSRIGHITSESTRKKISLALLNAH